MIRRVYSKSTLQRQFNGKMMYIPQDELGRQLTQPLLMDDQVTENEIFNFIRGYLVYLLADDNAIINYAFLVNSNEILVHKMSSELASKARIQNFIKGPLVDYQFDVMDDDRKFSAKRAQLQPEIREDLMPIDRKLNMTGVQVPDKAIIYGVGLNMKFELMLTKYQVVKTINNFNHFKIVTKRKTCETEKNIQFILYGEPVFYNRKFVGILTNFNPDNLQDGNFEFEPYLNNESI